MLRQCPSHLFPGCLRGRHYLSLGSHEDNALLSFCFSIFSPPPDPSLGTAAFLGVMAYEETVADLRVATTDPKKLCGYTA